MALIYCPECGKQISDKAEKCVHCGYQINEIKVEPEKTTKKKGNVLGTIVKAVLISFFIIIIIGLLANGSNSGSRAGTTTTSNNVNEIELGTAYQLSNIVIQVDSCKFQKEVKSPTPVGYLYETYTADNGNKYFNATVYIKNTGSNSLSSVFSSVELVYKDSYTYSCFDIAEGKNGFEHYPIIEPLETLTYHFMVEVPEEVYASTEESLKLIFHDGNKSYVLKIR